MNRTQLKQLAKKLAVQQAQQKLQQHIAATGAVNPPTFTELKTGGGLLVGNWRDAWKWLSNWAFALIAYVATFGVPTEVLSVLPQATQSKVIGVAALLGIVFRLINQTRPKPIEGSFGALS